MFAMIVVMGYALYDLYTYYEIKISKVVYPVLILVAWWLPRGEESLKIYVRDAVAVCIIIYLLFHANHMLEKINTFCCKKRINTILKYSYSLYVVHEFSLIFFSKKLVIIVQGLTNHWWMTYLFSFLLKTMFDLGLAVVFYYIFEKLLFKKCCSLLKLQTL